MQQQTQVSALPKPSRTLVIPDVQPRVETLLSENKHLYKNFTKTEKKRVSCFIECDKLEDSINLYNLLSKNEIVSRYANYRMFIRITSDTNSHTYDEFKSMIKNKLNEVVDRINIMYFKLYQKNDRLTGNGYIVIDKYEDLKKIIKNNYVCNDSCVSFQLLNFVNKK